MKPKAEKTGLDLVIDKLLKEIADQDFYSEEYTTMVDQLVKLYSLKDNQSNKRVSKDTLVIVAGNLVGIVLIVGYERAHVVTSKALNFVQKLQ